MSSRIVTSIDARVDRQREEELREGYRQLNNGPQPDGLLHSVLLRGQSGTWRIETTWRDVDALMEVRQSGRPPAALTLLDALGAEHSHDVFTVEQCHSS